VLTYRSYGSRILLEGSIDDAADVLSVLDHAKKNQLALDLGGVRFINSIGVREWIRLLAAAAKQDISLAFHRVAVVMVHQLNLVPATRGGTIISFMAPYICEECDAEFDFELTPAEAKAGPEKTCRECKNKMVLRDPPEIYFAFLQA
jgi:hypothetical protein